MKLTHLLRGTAVAAGLALVIAGIAAAGAGRPAAAQSGCSFAGAWETNVGRVSFVANGSRIAGANPSAYGNYSGTQSGLVLSGRWASRPAGVESRGTFEVTMAAGCQSFSGSWRRGDNGPWTGTWTGTRLADAAPSACSEWNIEGIWQVALANGFGPTFELRQSGTTVTGEIVLSEEDQRRGSYRNTRGPVSGTMIGDQLELNYDGLVFTSGQTQKGTYSGTVSDGQWNGQGVASNNPQDAVRFTATGPTVCK